MCHKVCSLNQYQCITTLSRPIMHLPYPCEWTHFTCMTKADQGCLCLAQVCDFNLSRVMEESAILSSMAASNPRWLAPEILSGRGYTFSSDVYSFGVIMWEFLTWQIPWHECGPWQVLACPLLASTALSCPKL